MQDLTPMAMNAQYECTMQDLTPMALGLTLLNITVVAGLYTFKQQLLGIELYFIPSTSMQPTLEPEDIVLADTWINAEQLKAGDIIVFQHPSIQGMKIIKRISKMNRNETVRVLGDNPRNSLDSRLLGSIDMRLIEARATTLIHDLTLTKLHRLN